MSRASFKICFCCRRIFKLKPDEPPEDIKWFFDKYSIIDGPMSINELHRFLIEVQGEENATIDDAQAIFDSLRHLRLFHRRGLHLEVFFRYLLSDLNSAFPPNPQVNHDMTKPMSHYFIYTGHNSYLTGNQFSSNSSIDPIIKALRRGVRVIELDLWPNPGRDKAEVRHGGTLTSAVALQKCLNAIRDNAFYASEYPVVITFEDHLTPDLQAQVAKMVIKTFGDMLFLPKSEYAPNFPSPYQLRNKILISTKPPKEYAASQSNRDKGNMEDSVLDEVSITTHDKPRLANELERNKKDQVDGGEHIPDEDEDTVIPEYRHIIAIHAGKQKGGLQNWLSDDPSKVRRLSLSEQELDNFSKTHGTEIVKFTHRNLLRIYPKGTRVGSSNYNPLIGWMHGAQMVASNMQGHDKYLWMMHGMFMGNGGCGYMKKPDFLLTSEPVFDPIKIHIYKTTLKVKVYMGEGWDVDFSRTHFDQFSPPDFFTRIGVVGVPVDTTKPMSKTKTIFDQWLPVWNEEFKFHLTVPELALLRVEVDDFDTSRQHDFGGQTCLLLSELRTGIRSVPLYNRKGEKYRAVRLLMHFEFDPPYEFQHSLNPQIGE